MGVINLTKAEREKFAAWLEQKANQLDRAAEHLQKQDHITYREAAAKSREEAIGCRVIGRVLRGMEEQVVSR